MTSPLGKKYRLSLGSELGIMVVMGLFVAVLVTWAVIGIGFPEQ